MENHNVKPSTFLRISFFASLAFIALAASARIAIGSMPATEKIQMHALNSSGQNGVATLTDLGGKVYISVKITGEPATASEPAHVHFGRCPTIKAVPAYNVGPILAGKAASVVHLSWAEINSGKYALNVHQSLTKMGTYVSCGNIGVAAKP